MLHNQAHTTHTAQTARVTISGMFREIGLLSSRLYYLCVPPLQFSSSFRLPTFPRSRISVYPPVHFGKAGMKKVRLGATVCPLRSMYRLMLCERCYLSVAPHESGATARLTPRQPIAYVDEIGKKNIYRNTSPSYKTENSAVEPGPDARNSRTAVGRKTSGRSC